MSKIEVGVIIIVTEPVVVDASKREELAPVAFLSGMCPIEGCCLVQEL